VIAGWLGSKFAAIDRNVPKTDREYDETKSVHQEVDEHLEISPTRPGEQSLACPLSGQFWRVMVEWTQIHTEQNDEIQEKQDINQDYCVKQVQIPLHGLNDGGKEETESVDDGVLVHPTQKLFCVHLLWCKSSDEYRGVEIDADLERRSSNDNMKSTVNRGRRRLTPIPAMSGFELKHVSAID
jgi:hypothetical protein